MCNITGIQVGSISTTIVRCIKKNLLRKRSLRKGGREAIAEYQVINIDETSYSRILLYNNIKTITTIEGEDRNFSENRTYKIDQEKTVFLNPNRNLNPNSTPSLYNSDSMELKSSHDPSRSSNKLTFSDLPEEWQRINYHLLDDLHFKEHHLVSLYKLNILESETVQESINHFAYGMKNNPENYTKYTDPLKVFIGRLRKGEQWTESTYRSPKEIAIEELKEKRKEEKKKISDETCKLVDGLEQESYQKWFYSLKEERGTKGMRAEYTTTTTRRYSSFTMPNT